MDEGDRFQERQGRPERVSPCLLRGKECKEVRERGCRGKREREAERGDDSRGGGFSKGQIGVPMQQFSGAHQYYKGVFFCFFPGAYNVQCCDLFFYLVAPASSNVYGTLRFSPRQRKTQEVFLY